MCTCNLLKDISFESEDDLGSSFVKSITTLDLFFTSAPTTSPPIDVASVGRTEVCGVLSAMNVIYNINKDLFTSFSNITWSNSRNC